MDNQLKMNRQKFSYSKNRLRYFYKILASIESSTKVQHLEIVENMIQNYKMLFVNEDSTPHIVEILFDKTLEKRKLLNELYHD